jgi:hypothetical protein
MMAMLRSFMTGLKSKAARPHRRGDAASIT